MDLEKELQLAAKQFYEVYPVLLEEIDRMEAKRGELNDFQLMLAVNKAKDSMGLMSWERRKLLNALFETYMDVYRQEGREQADLWVEATLEPRPASEPKLLPIAPDRQARIEELSQLIQLKESELLQLYRELYALQGWVPPVVSDRGPS